MQSPYWGLPCCLRCLLTPPGPIPLSRRNRSIQCTAEPLATIVSAAAHARPTPTMHAAVHMRTHSNALHSFPPNASQRALSRSPTPSRGPPRRSPTNDTGRCSVSSQPLDDCSGWFSSSDQQGELSPADEWIQKATTEQSGGAGAGGGQVDVLTHFTTLDQSLKCTVSSISSLPSSRGYLQGRGRARESGDWAQRQLLRATALWSKVHRKVRTGRSPGAAIVL